MKYVYIWIWTQGFLYWSKCSSSNVHEWFAWSKEGRLGIYLVFSVSCPCFLMSKCWIRKWQVTSQVKRGYCGDCDCERRGTTISQDVTKERPGLLWKFKWKTNVCKHFSHDIRFLGLYIIDCLFTVILCILSLKFILSSFINNKYKYMYIYTPNDLLKEPLIEQKLSPLHRAGRTAELGKC